MVPVDLACRVAGARHCTDDTLDETVTRGKGPETSEFCLDATFVAYQGQWYQKTFGTAMGSPVSFTVQNLVMENVEERALTSFTTPPPLWKRYVDDTCVVILPDLLESFHTHLNSIEPKVNLINELEE